MPMNDNNINGIINALSLNISKANNATPNNADINKIIIVLRLNGLNQLKNNMRVDTQ